MKKNLLDLTLAELEIELSIIGEQKFRAKQLTDWFYKKNIFDIEQMSNLSAPFKEKIKNSYEITLPTIHYVSKAKNDVSYKFLLKTSDGKLLESVLMLEEDRATICVSSMIGCPLACAFCATGSDMKFVRNLTTSEIVAQILVIRKYAQENNIAENITNLVFMGMGEPLLNLQAVDKTLEILMADYGLGMSRSRITLSTAGVSDKMADFINKHRVRLAISFHFTTDEIRNKYMPINKKFPIFTIIENLKKIKLLSHDFITIEYIMIKDINDRLEDAKRLINLLKGIKIKVNMIPLNPIKSFKEETSTEEAIDQFVRYLWSKNIIATVRRSKGKDVDGACGQLALSQKEPNLSACKPKAATSNC